MKLVHEERRALPYPPEALFDMVVDVERYPEFLPWCTGLRITRREGNIFWADLLVGYRMLREKFSSRVVLDPAGRRIDVTYISGPLKSLENHWYFEPQPDGSTIVDFHVSFEFRSGLFRRLAELFFDEIVRRMVGAFEQRAHALYGAKASDAA